VIVERFGLRDRVGSLCTLGLDPPGGPPWTVARPPHHISYPYVVVDGDDANCVPETSALREVGLYRLIAAPRRLEKVVTLTPDEFAEEVAAVLPPFPGHSGTGSTRWPRPAAPRS
jgi:hypothetical protein